MCGAACVRPPPGCSLVAGMSRDTALQLVLVGAVGVLALAGSHFFFHWVLYSEPLMQRILF